MPMVSRYVLDTSFAPNDSAAPPHRDRERGAMLHPAPTWREVQEHIEPPAAQFSERRQDLGAQSRAEEPRDAESQAAAEQAEQQAVGAELERDASAAGAECQS